MRLHLVLIFLTALRLAAAPGPRIAIASGAVDAQGNASLDITFTPTADQPVAALQFDVAYPNGILTFSVSSGSAAGSAGKTLFTADVQPGVTRILMAGLNANTIGGGVVATLSIQVKSGTPAGVYPLAIANIAAADPNGAAASIAGNDGSVVVPGPGVPAPLVTAAANAASYAAGAVSPGEIIVLSGSSLGPSTVTQQLIGASALAGALAGTRVLFDGIPAPILYTSLNQVAAIVPYAVDGHARTSLQVEYQGIRSAPLQLAVTQAAPGIFSLNASGTGQGAIVNQDGTINAPDNPAPRGSVVSIFATGEGQTNPPGVDGAVVDVSQLKNPLLPVSASVGGQDAKVLYAGSAAGEVSGMFQANVQIPASISPAAAVPVTITVGGSSQPGITVAVR